MNPACGQLFELSLEHVDTDDVRCFCPGGIFASGGVAELSRIVSSHAPPLESTPGIKETFIQILRVDPEAYAEPDRFRRFRVMVSAVDLAIAAGPKGELPETPLNYHSIRLIEDLHALNDEASLGLLAIAFDELQQPASGVYWPEDVFLLLGQLILAFLGYHPSVDLTALAEQIIKSDRPCEYGSTREFLWGWSHNTMMVERWKYFVELSFPRSSENEWIMLLRKTLIPNSEK